MNKDNFRIKDEIKLELKRRSNKMESKLVLRGDAVIELRKEGKVIAREEVHNLIVNTGKERVTKLIGGISGTSFGYIGIGVGSTPANASDSDLEATVTVQACQSGSPSYEADYKCIFEKTFTFGESYTITEAGIFDGGSSGATLLDRFTFTDKEVDSDTDLYVKVTITVA